MGIESPSDRLKVHELLEKTLPGDAFEDIRVRLKLSIIEIIDEAREEELDNALEQQERNEEQE